MRGPKESEEKRRKKRERDARRKKEKLRIKRVKLIRKTLLYTVIFAVIGGVGYGIYLASISSPAIGPVGSTHEHVVFALFLDGVPLDFSPQRFQVRNQRVHFEAGDGFLVHKHATGVTMGFFLDTLDIELNSTFIILYNGTEYVNQGGKTVKMLVNGVENNGFGEYVLNERDQILISYGDESQEEISGQLEFLSDLASRLPSPDN